MADAAATSLLDSAPPSRSARASTLQKMAYTYFFLFTNVHQAQHQAYASGRSSTFRSASHVQRRSLCFVSTTRHPGDAPLKSQASVADPWGIRPQWKLGATSATAKNSARTLWRSASRDILQLTILISPLYLQILTEIDLSHVSRLDEQVYCRTPALSPYSHRRARQLEVAEEMVEQKE